MAMSCPALPLLQGSGECLTLDHGGPVRHDRGLFRLASWVGMGFSLRPPIEAVQKSSLSRRLNGRDVIRARMFLLRVTQLGRSQHLRWVRCGMFQFSRTAPCSSNGRVGHGVGLSETACFDARQARVPSCVMLTGSRVPEVRACPPAAPR